MSTVKPAQSFSPSWSPSAQRDALLANYPEMDPTGVAAIRSFFDKPSLNAAPDCSLSTSTHSVSGQISQTDDLVAHSYGMVARQDNEGEITQRQQSIVCDPVAQIPTDQPGTPPERRHAKHDEVKRANPARGKTEAEMAEMRRHYKPGDNVIPKIDTQEGSDDSEDERLLGETMALSMADIDPAVEANRRARVNEQRVDRRARQQQTNAPRVRDTTSRQQPSTWAAQRARDVEERQVEHQPSLRSLLSASESDSQEVQSEIMQSIMASGVLDGIDIENLTPQQEEALTERIAADLVTPYPTDRPAPDQSVRPSQSLAAFAPEIVQSQPQLSMTVPAVAYSGRQTKLVKAQIRLSCSKPVHAHMSTLRQGQDATSKANFVFLPHLPEHTYAVLSVQQDCDVCRRGLSSTDTHCHCNICNDGDYDICNDCYHNLIAHGKITMANGPTGWRRCLQGHRMAVIGSQDAGHTGKQRVVARGPVGGWALKEDEAELAAQQISQLVPPDGGVGMRCLALWNRFVGDGIGDEISFPKNAEIREVERMNEDWFWGVYAGMKGLFPANHVRMSPGEKLEETHRQIQQTTPFVSNAFIYNMAKVTARKRKPHGLKAGTFRCATCPLKAVDHVLCLVNHPCLWNNFIVASRAHAQRRIWLKQPPSTICNGRVSKVYGRMVDENGVEEVRMMVVPSGQKPWEAWNIYVEKMYALLLLPGERGERASRGMWEEDRDRRGRWLDEL
ncbi:hypothetical protein B0A48_01917 [Cryoendolithus antarcticus]|uniref:SH3 domain-containing protein n=1 Tax=Cryoendolithus antarcticus TaxID=1507870 RepID=A0A1V8TQY3_9PEZI|nr:hypothetical protein B0A48_01917 [Cryoendolithus antarcticus]